MHHNLPPYDLLEDAFNQLLDSYTDGTLPSWLQPLLSRHASILLESGRPDNARELLEKLHASAAGRDIHLANRLAMDLVLACFAVRDETHARELLRYHASRPYIVPDGDARAFFNLFHGVQAINDKDEAAFLHCVRQILSSRCKVKKDSLLRLVAQHEQGARSVLRTGGLGLGWKLLAAVNLLAPRIASRTFLGGLAAHGLRTILELLVSLSGSLGFNQVGLLCPRQTCSGNGQPCRKNSRLPVLVTRGMGGIGDILMMTPGLAALRADDPDREIHLALPRQLHPIVEYNPDVRVLDIQGDVFHREEYSSWRNLSNCPAARVEIASLPHVRHNRIDIFGKAIGAKAKTMDRLGRLPRYVVTEEERQWAGAFLAQKGLADRTVLALHLHTADSYKDYPHFETLAGLLAPRNPLLLFHNAPIAGFHMDNVWKVDSCTLRQSLALLSRCALLVAPDSALLHAAAALDVPTVALFGPTCGQVFTRHYPRTFVVDMRESMRCVPCWRAQHITCSATGTTLSSCMERIPPERIVQAIRKMLPPEVTGQAG